MVGTLRPRWYWVVAGSLFTLLAGVSLWNALDYPSMAGYDASAHYGYAYELVHHGRIPKTGEYYSPPGFYALAGVLVVAGEKLRLGDPARLEQLANVAFMVGTAILVLALARLLFPGRRMLQLSALGYLCFLPVLYKTGAMFHPEPLALFVAAATVYVGARALARRDLRDRTAVAVGLLLGLGQLVRPAALWTLAAILLALVAAATARSIPGQRALRFGLIGVATCALVVSPWYVRQALHYSNPIFAPHSAAAGKPIWSRRPASFYTGLGLGQVFSEPVRPHFRNEAFPTTYSELWGDYFGYFAWSAPGRPSGSAERLLARQNLLGLLPTSLALVGWVGLLGSAIRRRAQAAQLFVPALLALFGLLGYAYFTVSYPTADGDVLKATYLLITTPAWALGFALAFERLAGRRRLVRAGLVAVLVASGALMLPFLVYGRPLGFL